MRNLNSSRAGSSSEIPCLGCYMTVCFKTENKILPFGLSFKFLVKHRQECVSLKSGCCSDKSFPYIFASPSQRYIAAGFKDEVDMVLKKGWKTPRGRREQVHLLWTSCRSRIRPWTGLGMTKRPNFAQLRMCGSGQSSRARHEATSIFFCTPLLVALQNPNLQHFPPCWRGQRSVCLWFFCFPPSFRKKITQQVQNPS